MRSATRARSSFSKDGTRVFFAVAPPPAEKKDEADAPADDTKAVVDLWSYKDDYIQPIQKVRAERDRNRTFTAAYLIPERKIVQLADGEGGNRDALGEPAMGAGLRRSRIPSAWPITTSITPTPT